MSRPGWLFPVAGLVVLVVVWVGGLGLYPAALQRLRVKPNEIVFERPYIQHNIRMTRHAFGLDRVAGEGLPRRGEPQRGRAGPERPHHQEHPPVGPPAAAHHVRAAPGDPDLLQVPRRGQRPLHDQRRVSPGDALAAGAVVPAPARPAAELDQRAPDLHARLRARGGTGEPDQRGRAARVLRQGHPARGDRIPQDHPARDVLRRVRQRLRLRPHPVARARLSLGRSERLQQVRGAGRGPGGLLAVEAGLRGPLRRDQDPPLQRPHVGEPDHDLPEHPRPRAAGRAVRALRPRSVPRRHRRRATDMDGRRLHGERAVSRTPSPSEGWATTSGTR